MLLSRWQGFISVDFFFQGANLWTTWKGDKDLPGTYYSCPENGWMTTLVFKEFLVKFAREQKWRSILLILYGYLTHLDMNTAQFARRNDINIMKLPAHTTDVLQPLDKTCFQSLKNPWDQKLARGKGKQKLQDDDEETNEDESPDPLDDNSSLEDVDLVEPQPDDCEDLGQSENLKSRDFFLVKCKGVKCNKTTFKYVATVLRALPDNETELMGLKVRW
ncbi:hypothetical protein PR048_020527 [Dryococelus australis]|uniref:DDE-1 domain-containing protein n=1 Tax=Dryococelus australis TaxID=614101 RepID=A0ABQ9H6K6_9NEOP|nr:hypothetical protein PR048_020527 [Dryococelus australis]